MTGFANTKKWLNNLLQQGLHMAKFATTSLVATTVDYTLYLLLVDRVLAPEWANIVSYSTSAVINFLLQRRFIFDLRRPAWTAFGMAMSVSLGAILLSTGIIHLLNRIPFFRQYQPLTKLIATGLVFFYNYFFKRFAFEKRFLTTDQKQTTR